MNHHIRLHALAVCGAMPLAFFAFGLHAADACDPLYQAGIKSVQTPHHAYVTTTVRGGKPQLAEAIYADGVEYLQIQGKWMRNPMSHQDLLDIAQNKLKTHPDACTSVGDQTVDGEAVSVYKAHNNETGTDQQVRIFKSSGLMQSGSLTLPDGTVVEGRYHYDNVHAPAGAQ